MAPAAAAPIDTAAVSSSAAAAIEAAEARAWVDLYAAAPPDWAAAAGLGSVEMLGGLVLHWRASGRRFFSRAIGLGVDRPATETAVDRALEIWRGRGIEMFLLQSLPHCRPAAYERWLRSRGLEPFDRQDRIVRGAAPLGDRRFADAGPLTVEEVDRESAGEWSRFLQGAYRLDTGPWLPQLIGRAGWHQYVARADGEIVAARGMRIGPEGTAWLGMEGPVPGITTDRFGPDAAICERIVADGLGRGARLFIADIEAPSEAMDTPAYADFARLGFRRPYVRTHWTVP